MTYGQIRIIGGQWRGRKLQVPDVPNLRPTPNRIRETVFNWLTPVIHNAYCLDAFAGSGALGFEALSRGAAHVTMVDTSIKVVELLKEEKTTLKADNLSIYCADTLKHLKKPDHLFNIVFLDPPFQENLLLLTCHYLEDHKLLADPCYIYLEAQDPVTHSELPAGWQIIKNKIAGQVAYHLVKRSHIQ